MKNRRNMSNENDVFVKCSEKYLSFQKKDCDDNINSIKSSDADFDINSVDDLKEIQDAIADF